VGVTKRYLSLSRSPETLAVPGVVRGLVRPTGISGHVSGDEEDGGGGDGSTVVVRG